jgi:hypothetical protein
VLDHLFGTPGALGGNDNPFLGSEVLTQFRHTASP